MKADPWLWVTLALIIGIPLLILAGWQMGLFSIASGDAETSDSYRPPEGE